MPHRLRQRTSRSDRLDEVLGTNSRKTDAHAVVMAALRDRNQLRELSITEQLVVLRLLADRRCLGPAPRD